MESTDFPPPPAFRADRLFDQSLQLQRRSLSVINLASQDLAAGSNAGDERLQTGGDHDVRRVSGRRQGAPHLIDEVRQFTKLIDRQVGGLHCTDQLDARELIVGVEAEATGGPAGGTNEPDFFPVPQCPKREMGPSSDIADLMQAGAVALFTQRCHLPWPDATHLARCRPSRRIAESGRRGAVADLLADHATNSYVTEGMLAAPGNHV